MFLFLNWVEVLGLQKHLETLMALVARRAVVPVAAHVSRERSFLAPLC